MLDCIAALEAWYLSMEWMILDHDSITWGYLTIGYPGFPETRDQQPDFRDVLEADSRRVLRGRCTLENHGITQIEKQNTRNYAASKLAGHHERSLSKSAGYMTNINPMQSNNLYLYTRLRSFEDRHTWYIKKPVIKIHLTCRQGPIFTTISTLCTGNRKKSCLFLWFLSPATVGVIAYIEVWSNDQWLKYASKIDQNCYFQHVNS